MNMLSQTNYAEFGKLRFLDFFPRSREYIEDHQGGLESGIGLACSEGYRKCTVFTSPIGSDWQTSEIIVDFENGCPIAPANEFFKQLGLQISYGMSHAQVRQALGEPVEDIPTYLRFIVGQEWPYYLDCYIKEREGLFKVWICRKDLADQQIAAES